MSSDHYRDALRDCWGEAYLATIGEQTPLTSCNLVIKYACDALAQAEEDVEEGELLSASLHDIYDMKEVPDQALPGDESVGAAIAAAQEPPSSSSSPEPASCVPVEELRKLRDQIAAEA